MSWRAKTVLLIVLLAGTLERTGADQGGQTSDVALKAALLYNFAMFTQWPALRPRDRMLACIVGDDRVADALIEVTHGRSIDGHPLDVGRPADSTTWAGCAVLFVSSTEKQRFSDALATLRALPILTVGDGAGFAQAGLIELYVDASRVRFAINLDAVERSGLHLSSRLLALAKIVRNGQPG